MISQLQIDAFFETKHPFYAQFNSLNLSLKLPINSCILNYGLNSFPSVILTVSPKRESQFLCNYHNLLLHPIHLQIYDNNTCYIDTIFLIQNLTISGTPGNQQITLNLMHPFYFFTEITLIDPTFRNLNIVISPERFRSLVLSLFSLSLEASNKSNTSEISSSDSVPSYKILLFTFFKKFFVKLYQEFAQQSWSYFNLTNQANTFLAYICKFLRPDIEYELKKEATLVSRLLDLLKIYSDSAILLSWPSFLTYLLSLLSTNQTIFSIFQHFAQNFGLDFASSPNSIYLIPKLPFLSDIPKDLIYQLDPIRTSYNFKATRFEQPYLTILYPTDFINLFGYYVDKKNLQEPDPASISSAILPSYYLIPSYINKKIELRSNTSSLTISSSKNLQSQALKEPSENQTQSKNIPSTQTENFIPLQHLQTFLHQYAHYLHILRLQQYNEGSFSCIFLPDLVPGQFCSLQSISTAITSLARIISVTHSFSVSSTGLTATTSCYVQHVNFSTEKLPSSQSIELPWYHPTKYTKFTFQDLSEYIEAFKNNLSMISMF